MSRPLLLPVRHTLAVLACVLPLAAAQAQSPVPAPAPDAAAQSGTAGRQNQKIENIHVEDSGASVDEVRYGGQTQSIKVTPKAKGMPSYEVLPGGNAYSPQGQPAQSESGGNGGSRVWNVFKF
jgi:hypothetical protein